MGVIRPMTATAAEVCRNFGLWQDRVARGPVMVTNHGRIKSVLMSADCYQDMLDGERVGAPASGEAAIARMSDAYLLFDERMTLATANPAALAYLRSEAPALIGRTPGDIFGGASGGTIERTLVRVAATGGTRHFETGGSGSCTLRMQAFASGRGVGLMFSVADEDSETAARLAELEALGSLLVANGQAGIGRLGLRGVFTGVGASLIGLLGYDRERLLRARLTDVVSDRHRDAVDGAIDQVLGDGALTTVDGAMMTVAGQEVPVTLALAPTRTACAIDGAALLVTPLRGQRPGSITAFG